MKGAKLVLFITGKCSKSCFYCPISEERRDRDIVFANEVEVDHIQQALTEARLINATGMGITGGEPLIEVERTCQFIQAFKQEFGPKFHVHLYTGLEPVPINAVEQLLEVGLDELRLHRFHLGQDYPRLREVTKGRAQLGVEVPMIPGMINQLKKMFRQLDEIGIDFVNINELEYSEVNAKELKQRGLQLDPDTMTAVKGSEEEAINLLEWATNETQLNVHFCPLSLKDGIQLRNRFRRRAKNVAKPFEQITEEGLLLKGIITPPPNISLIALSKILLNEYQIPLDQFWINESLGRIETSTTIVQRLVNQLKVKKIQVGIAEEYPTINRIQVSYVPL